MGGYGSGRWRSACYATVEECCTLELARVSGGSGLSSDRLVQGCLTWRRSEEILASASYRFDSLDPARARLVISSSVNRDDAPRRELSESFKLETTRPHYGGLRWWVHCPCGRRCAKLYLPLGARVFRCRVCYRLANACQRERPSDRLRRRAEKTWRRLGGVKGDGLVYKPKWMRWRTFDRLMDQAEERISKSIIISLAPLFNPNSWLSRALKRA